MHYCHRYSKILFGRYTEILDVPQFHMTSQYQDPYQNFGSAATAKPKKLVLKYAMKSAMGYIA